MKMALRGRGIVDRIKETVQTVVFKSVGYTPQLPKPVNLACGD